MAWVLVLAHLALPLSVAAAASVGAWRCARLLRYGEDPRLQKLMAFYGLFAASLVLWALHAGRVAAAVGGALPSGGAAGLLDAHARFAAVQRPDLFLVAHHLLMLASLVVGVQAFAQKRGPRGAPALAALAVFAALVPALLALEAGLALYLAVRAFLNHRERRTRGALQVAAGFFLFFVGHLSFFVLYHPAGVRTPLGDLLSLVGIVLLVQLLPRPTA